ncbi:hypothetical protein MK852_10415 [Shewanella benthica]|nr:hypothetical protein [Shewanella benthica]
MKKIIAYAALFSAGIVFSTASFAGINMLAECNDCSSLASQRAANKLQGKSVFVVDFVNRTAKKYIVKEEGNALLTSMTLGELNRINQQFDYRKVHLRSVKP